MYCAYIGDPLGVTGRVAVLRLERADQHLHGLVVRFLHRHVRGEHLLGDEHRHDDQQHGRARRCSGTARRGSSPAPRTASDSRAEGVNIIAISRQLACARKCTAGARISHIATTHTSCRRDRGEERRRACADPRLREAPGASARPPGSRDRCSPSSPRSATTTGIGAVGGRCHATCRRGADRAAPRPWSLNATTDAIMTRKPALIDVPSANSTARCSLQIISALSSRSSAPRVRRGTRDREEASEAAGRDERHTCVEREPLLLGHVFFLGTEIDEGERRQGLGLKKLLAQTPSSATAEQQRHQASRSCSQTNRHLLHRELPLAMHLRLHRYG